MPGPFRPRTALRVAVLLAILAGIPLLPGARFARAAAAAPPSGVFVLVTADKTTWEPYEYGSAFFFNVQGDAYTASHVVADAVRNPDLRLVAIVNGVEYIARAICWNPASSDRATDSSYSRDVAVVRIGPEVPLFPIGRYPPAAGRLTAHPLAVRRGAVPAVDGVVRVVGFGEHHATPKWVFVENERQGRVVRVERATDGTPIARVGFSAGGAPSDGDSGGPILDAAGEVVGVANWTRAHPITPNSAEMDGVAAAGLGCVASVPPERNQLDRFNTPLRRP